MKKIKLDILHKSLELFTKQGVSAVSIRQIASELGISHSHLIYHFKTKNELIEALHNQLLAEAVRLNREPRQHENFVADLLIQTRKGFTLLYEYRFLMLELNLILRENPSLKKTFQEVEKLRAIMYKEAIFQAVDQHIMQPETYPGEYDTFIEHIKIFSDSWLASSEIYDADSKDKIIEKYSLLFVKLFYPYFTAQGREYFLSIFKIEEKS